MIIYCTFISSSSLKAAPYFSFVEAVTSFLRYSTASFLGAASIILLPTAVDGFFANDVIIGFFGIGFLGGVVMFSIAPLLYFYQYLITI